MIGAGGRRSLRIVAEHADIWNCPTRGDAAEFRRLSGVLDEHRADIGRDPATIVRSVQILVHATSGPAAAAAGQTELPRINDTASTRDLVLDFVEAGARHVVLAPVAPNVDRPRALAGGRGGGAGAPTARPERDGVRCCLTVGHRISIRPTISIVPARRACIARADAWIIRSAPRTLVSTSGRVTSDDISSTGAKKAETPALLMGGDGPDRVPHFGDRFAVGHIRRLRSATTSASRSRAVAINVAASRLGQILKAWPRPNV